METVSISSQDYDSYATVADADLYLNAASHADDWRAIETQDEKGRFLVTSTRTLDRQTWKPEYDTQAERIAVPSIVNASIELALALAGGSETQENSNTAEKFRSISAGSVSITNSWRAFESPTRFPLIVQELLGPYLGGTGEFFGAKAEGVDGETIFPIDLGFNGGL